MQLSFLRKNSAEILWWRVRPKRWASEYLLRPAAPFGPQQRGFENRNGGSEEEIRIFGKNWFFREGQNLPQNLHAH